MVVHTDGGICSGMASHHPSLMVVSTQVWRHTILPADRPGVPTHQRSSTCAHTRQRHDTLHCSPYFASTLKRFCFEGLPSGPAAVFSFGALGAVLPLK